MRTYWTNMKISDILYGTLITISLLYFGISTWINYDEYLKIESFIGKCENQGGKVARKHNDYYCFYEVTVI